MAAIGTLGGGTNAGGGGSRRTPPPQLAHRASSRSESRSASCKCSSSSVESASRAMLDETRPSRRTPSCSHSSAANASALAFSANGFHQPSSRTVQSGGPLGGLTPPKPRGSRSAPPATPAGAQSRCSFCPRRSTASASSNRSERMWSRGSRCAGPPSASAIRRVSFESR